MQSSAVRYIQLNDEAGLSDLLAEVCQVYDDDKDVVPLPEDHWINKPCDDTHRFKTLLHLAIENGNVSMVEKLLRAGARAENYNDVLGKCPIHVAVEADSRDMLETLLKTYPKNTANVDSVDQSGKTALHLAVEKDKAELVQVLVDHDCNVDAQDGLGRRTPLYIAAHNKSRNIARILLENGASTLHTCYGKTVQETIEEMLPDLDVSSINMIKKQRRNSRDDFGYGLKKILDQADYNRKKKCSNSQNLLQFKALLQTFSASDLDSYIAEGSTLLQSSCVYGLDKFAALMLEQGADPNLTTTQDGTAPILSAAYYGHYQVMDLFINHKITSIESAKTANLSVTERHTKESVLHHLLEIPSRNEKTPEEIKNFESSLHLLLDCEDSRVHEELLDVINKKDIRGNVPLHYATNLWPQAIVRKLLDRGANIGIKNIWDELPISKILPSTLEDFLNETCVTSNGQPVTSQELMVTLDYSFLAPPVADDLSEEDRQEMIEKQALPETECLWYMGQSKQHRHLLKHPVVTSFLWLKWQKVRGYFNRNLRFYLLFVMSLTWYIFVRYGGISSRLPDMNNTKTYPDELNETGFCSELSLRTYPTQKFSGAWYIVFCIHAFVQLFLMVRDGRRDISNIHGACDVLRFIFITSWLDWTILGLMGLTFFLSTSALYYVLTILLVLFILREAFQMSVSLKRYIFTPENWLEGLLIVLVGTILWIPDSSFASPCETKRHFAAISLVLSWAEMITLVARHPKLSEYNIYVTMFFTVLKTFTKFLASIIF